MNGRFLILPCIQHKVVLLVSELYSPWVSDYSVSCSKALGKNTLADRCKIVRQHSSSICASTQFTNVLELHFKIEFDQHFVQRVLRSRFTLNLKI